MRGRYGASRAPRKGLDEPQVTDPSQLVSFDFGCASVMLGSGRGSGRGSGEAARSTKGFAAKAGEAGEVEDAEDEWESPEDVRNRERRAAAEAARLRRGGLDPSVPFCRAIEGEATAEALTQRMRVTETQARDVEFYEQGTEAWLLSRRGTQTRLPSGEMYGDTLDPAVPHPFVPGRLTASNFGTAVGHNKYAPPETLVEDMLWGTVVSNEAMRYGSMMEPKACEVFEWWTFLLSGGGTQIEHRGLMLACPELWDPASETFEGWCGTSPDGIVRPAEAKGLAASLGAASPCRRPSLLEIKCPSVNKRTFYSERQGNERFGIPHYYYDQIMGICGLQHLQDAYFVVHLPDRTQISWFAFNEPYFRELLVGMRRFWFDLYLPNALACARGELRVGQVLGANQEGTPGGRREGGAPSAAKELAERGRKAEAIRSEGGRRDAAKIAPSETAGAPSESAGAPSESAGAPSETAGAPSESAPSETASFGDTSREESEAAAMLEADLLSLVAVTSDPASVLFAEGKGGVEQSEGRMAAEQSEGRMAAEQSEGRMAAEHSEGGSRKRPRRVEVGEGTQSGTPSLEATQSEANASSFAALGAPT